ncbi:A24 family peptidase [Sandaracinus amylolyticus]|uniref:Type IV prepilin peptidase TadV/CpaA n=1 Tax=Sandaracinus amylolyticus TaxID=927083 RepID=A0A0F6WAL4_9BACT|nr:A24 family peptidase [Sandaracinus amylolyticus]AKF11655.1 Type IV prepilin peptidase TadV/CpaA [Sandaracinus amylolyticus]
MFGLGPDPELLPYLYGLAVVMTAVAAFTDWRTGHIPNWLTLPPLFLAPLVHGLMNGAEGFFGSILAVAICGAVPLLMFWRGGMAGGDVKLFAAIAAVCGIEVGLEAEFLAFIVAGIYALGRLAWQGKLLRTLGNSLYMGMNPLLPQRLRKPISPELLHTLRLGGAIFAGTLIAVFSRLQTFFMFGT